MQGGKLDFDVYLHYNADPFLSAAIALIADAFLLVANRKR
jgi:hypothetical protein